jgi:hypothetical protein
MLRWTFLGVKKFNFHRFTDLILYWQSCDWKLFTRLKILALTTVYVLPCQYIHCSKWFKSKVDTRNLREESSAASLVYCIFAKLGKTRWG